MGRTLPWKKGEPRRAVTETSSSPRPTGNASRPSENSPSSSRAASTPLRTVSHPRPVTPTSHPKAKQVSSSHGQTLGRSLSSSPPPEPIPESYMIDGFENDDQWRMVEDEFYAVAGHFTAHLHAAQYRRLREEAKNQNPNTIPTISRPVTGPPTSHVKRRQAALALAAAQRRGVKTARSRINGDDTEDEDDEVPWKGTHLAGLMNSPRKKVQPLANMPFTVTGSRAAALSSQRNRLVSPSTSNVAFSHHSENYLSSGPTNSHRMSNHLVRQKASRSRTTSERAQALNESEDDDDLERYSSRQPSTYPGFPRTQPGTLGIEKSMSSQTRSVSSPADAASASKGSVVAKPAPISRSVSAVSKEEEEDSGAETYFQRRMKERRGRRTTSRHKSSTPDEPGEEDESQASRQKSQKNQSAIFIVPSF